MFRDGGVLAEPRFGNGVFDFDEGRVGIELVEALVGGEVEIALVLATGADDSAGSILIRGFGEAIELGTVPFWFAGVGVGVGEPGRGFFERGGTGDTNPGSFRPGREGVPTVAIDFDFREFCPLIVSLEIDFESKGRRGVGEEVNGAVLVAGKEVGIGSRACFDLLIEPDRTTSDDRAEMIELLWFDKPEVGLGLRGGDVAFGFALVEELGLGGVVAAHHDVVAPAGEVADDLEVGRAG